MPSKKSRPAKRGKRSTANDFIRKMLWTECRHRRAGRAGKAPFREIGACAIALKEDPRARVEFGRGNCQKAGCPYLDRDEVP